MKRTVRSIAVAVATGGLLLCAAAPVSAGAQHAAFEESYDGSFHLSAEENPCGPWSVTIREVRTGGASIVAAPGGRVVGEYHINGAVDGLIELIPDDAALPTYAGSYREKFSAVITGTDADGQDVMRVAHYRLRAPMTGSDGSRLVLAMSGKVTLNAAGEMVVGRDSMTCE